MAMKLWLNYTHGNSSPQHSNSLEIAGVWFCVLFKGSSWGRWFVVWIYSQPGFELNLGSGFYLLFLEQITLTCWTKVSPSITREELNYHGFKIRVLGSINQPLALCTMYDRSDSPLPLSPHLLPHFLTLSHPQLYWPPSSSSNITCSSSSELLHLTFPYLWSTVLPDIHPYGSLFPILQAKAQTSSIWGPSLTTCIK